MSIRTPTRRGFLPVAFLAMALVTSASAQNGATALNIAPGGLAMKGYDPVAYLADSKAVAGTTDFTATHAGATYRFSSAEHRATFLAQPRKYLPEYGGYCAMGVAVGKKLDTDPTLWQVVDGKLYLHVNKDAQGMWLKDPTKHIKTAQKKWAKVSARSGFDTM
jgi:YHS domain-containing protein